MCSSDLWAATLGRQAFSIDRPFSALEQLKFRQTISPGLALELSLSWNADTGRLAFAYCSERGEHARGTLLFTALDHAT